MIDNKTRDITQVQERYDSSATPKNLKRSKRKARVIAKTEKNYYDIVVLQDSGGSGILYTNVVCQPYTELAVGAQVWAEFNATGKPIITSSISDGASTCAMQVNTFGVLFN